jgi:hypothetical protein
MEFSATRKSEDAAKMTFKEVTGNDLHMFLQQWQGHWSKYMTVKGNCFEGSVQ